MPGRGRTIRGAWVVSVLLCGLTIGIEAQGQTGFPTGVTPDAERPSGAAPDVALPDSGSPPTTITLGARLRTLFTDNGGLQPAGNKQSDFVTEVNPYLSATAYRPTIRGSLSYGLRALNSARDTIPDSIQHDLRAYGDMALASDRLWLSGRALVTNLNGSPFAAAGADPALTPQGNRIRYKRFELAPYFLGRIENVADYQVRYRAGYYDSGLPGFRATEQALSARARSLGEASRFGWQMSGETAQRRYSNDFSYGTHDLSVAGLFAYDSAWLMGVSANYSRVEIVVDSQGRNNGWGPGFLLQWRPSERTSLAMDGAHQYYGNVGKLRFSHRASQWTFALNAQRVLLSPSESGVLYLDPSQQFGGDGRAGNNPVVDNLVRQGLLNPAGSLFSLGLQTAAVSMDTSFNASLGIVGARNTLIFTVLSTRRTPANMTTAALTGLPQYFDGAWMRGHGGLITYRRALSTTSSLVVRGSVTDWRNGNIAETSRLLSASIGYYTDLSTRLRAYLEYRRSRQRTDGPSALGYDENAIIAAIDFRF